ncbi:MAG: hypothetical protein N2645_13205 [Clostridia bacterium]|nr:hypothetical protein [Clostridia bacterium]
MKLDRHLLFAIIPYYREMEGILVHTKTRAVAKLAEQDSFAAASYMA